jgi:hypothetical protein
MVRHTSGSLKMRKLTLTIILIGLGMAAVAQAATAFYIGETTSGLHKICYYDHLGDTVAITIKSHKVCPVTITI